MRSKATIIPVNYVEFMARWTFAFQVGGTKCTSGLFLMDLHDKTRILKLFCVKVLLRFGWKRQIWQTRGARAQENFCVWLSYLPKLFQTTSGLQLTALLWQNAPRPTVSRLQTCASPQILFSQKVSACLCCRDLWLLLLLQKSQHTWVGEANFCAAEAHQVQLELFSGLKPTIHYVVETHACMMLT